MNNYVKQMERESIKRFDDEMALNRFRKIYKLKIENGLTKEIFQSKYTCTIQDLEMFDKIKAEIEKENRLGEAFLKGFNSR